MTLEKSAKYSAAFLDRDGVINKRLLDAYVTTPGEFEFLPDALEAIKILSQNFQYLFIVTNQQGIGRNLMSFGQLEMVHKFMLENISAKGGRIDKIYICPHLSREGCECRKPNNGMFINALNDYPDIVPEKSIMVGDTINDLIFGRKSGLKTIFISDEIHTDVSTLKLADEQFGSLFEMAKQFI